LLSRETLNEQEILEVTGLLPARPLENGMLSTSASVAESMNPTQQRARPRSS